MSTSVILRIIYRNKDGPIVWRLDNLDKRTAQGIADTLFYVFEDDPNRYNYAVEVSDDRGTRTVTYLDIVNLIAETGQTSDEIDDHIRRVLYFSDNKWTVLVLRPFRNSVRYHVIFAPKPEHYLQGILTIANYYDMSINDILVRKPYKMGYITISTNNNITK